MSIKYNRSFISKAKKLRKEMTTQEKHLWYDFLSTFPIRFQRQKIIENYITDFYCHNAKLVLELDGSQHFLSESLGYDFQRTTTLNKLGLKVIRFTNFEIERNFVAVCQEIEKIVYERINRLTPEQSQL